MPDLSVRVDRTNERLNRINFLLSRESGAPFLNAFVQRTGEIFAADCVFLARIDANSTRMHTLHVASSGDFSENFCYLIAGTPCAEVMENGATVYEDRLASHFPRDFAMSEMGVQAYVGVPLYDGARAVGIAVAMFKRPIDIGDEVLAVFNHYRRRLTSVILARETDERAALAIKGTSDGIIDWCVETDEIYISPRGRELLGYQAREFTGTSNHFVNLLHRDDKPRFEFQMKSHFASGRPFDLSVRLRVVGGTHRWFRVRAEAVRSPDGDPIRLVGAMTDIHDLVEARQQATEASRAKSKFIATMSHEIRTPLNGVLGMSSLLASTQLDGSQREMLANIEKSGRDLLDILNDILDLANIESGRFEVHDDTYNPSQLLANVIGPYRLKAGEKGLNLHLEIDPCADVDVVGDPARIRQILSNLLSNAVKFTERGEIRVRCLVRQNETGSHDVIFEMADTGPGMDADLMGRIFMPFTQGESELSRKHGGTGLGLPIARKLAELMGGDIRVESAPGAGAVFTVHLPAASPQGGMGDIAAE